MWPGNGSLSGDLKSKWHAFLFGRKTLLPSDPRIIDFAIEGGVNAWKSISNSDRSASTQSKSKPCWESDVVARRPRSHQ
jgi:hypothetical protein